MFLVQRGELEGRFDPDMILYSRKLFKFNYDVKPLKQFLKIKPQYGANEPGLERFNNQELRYIRITDIDEYGQLKNDLGATVKVSEAKYLLKNNDLLIARSGATAGKAYLHKLENVNYSCIYAGYMIRFVLDESKLLPDYFFVYTQLSFYKEWVLAIQRTAGQPNINAEEYKSLIIPIPPLDIQQQIVSIFEAAYAEKQQKETQAAQLLASIDGYLLEKLGITLPQAVEKKKTFVVWSDRVSGGRFDPAFYKPEYIQLLEGIRHTRYEKLSHLVKFSSETWNQKDYFKDDFPYIEISEINLSKGIISNVNQVKILEAPSRAKMIVRKGDIIISTTRPNRGAIAKISENEDFSIASTGFAILRHYDKSKIVPNYLHTILRHRICLTQMEQRSSGGNYPAITQDELGNINIPIPSISVQQEIVLHLEKITKQAQQLETEAKTALAAAKRAVEKQILGYTRYKMDCEKS
jgi:restriction endonuclease S subunit